MADVSYIDDNDGSAFSGTEIDFTHGLTISEDDFLVAIVHRNANGDAMSPPAGWTTEFEGDSLSGETSRILIASLSAGASEPTNYVFDIAVDVGTRNSISITQFRADDNTPCEVAVGPSWADGNDGAATAPSISVESGDAGFAAAFFDTSTFAVSGPDNSYINIGEEANQVQAYAYREWATSGASGAVAWSHASRVWDAMHLAVRNSVGGASTRPSGLTLLGVGS